MESNECEMIYFAGYIVTREPLGEEEVKKGIDNFDDEDGYY